jgi:phosphatidylethanolamine/phosphatidyl-N-methylethanolamine N-methyltransferase
VIEKGLMPVVRPLGFRTDFAWSRYDAWVTANDTHGMEFVERQAIPPLGHFSLIRFRKSADARVADEQQSVHVVPIRHVNTKLSSAGN